MTSILLLARHYPPAVSGGARRPGLLVEALRDLGAQVFVVAPSLPAAEVGRFGLAVPHPNRDPSTAPEQRLGRSLKDLAREWLLWPDPDIRWAMRAARAAAEAVPFQPDWILTTSPPESLHVAGAWLKRRLRARWAADFRDTWLYRPHRQQRSHPLRRAGEALVARAILPGANLVLAVDPVVAADIKRLGARAPVVLPHFSPDRLPPPARLMDDRLNVVHAGSIELSDPSARIEDLLTPFRTALADNPQLHLHLVGRLSHRERVLAGECPEVTLHGPKSYEEALALIGAADALALVASRKMHVPPSKIVDYLATDKPILAFGEGEWRQDPRTPRSAALEVMRRLRKGDIRTDALPAPKSTRGTAQDLLSLMEQHSAPRSPGSR